MRTIKKNFYREPHEHPLTTAKKSKLRFVKLPQAAVGVVSGKNKN